MLYLRFLLYKLGCGEIHHLINGSTCIHPVYRLKLGFSYICQPALPEFSIHSCFHPSWKQTVVKVPIFVEWSCTIGIFLQIWESSWKFFASVCSLWDPHSTTSNKLVRWWNSFFELGNPREAWVCSGWPDGAVISEVNTTEHYTCDYSPILSHNTFLCGGKPVTVNLSMLPPAVAAAAAAVILSSINLDTYSASHGREEENCKRGKN